MSNSKETKNKTQGELNALRNEVSDLKQKLAMRTQMENVLGDLGATFDILVSSLPDALAICNLEGNITYASPQKAVLYGYKNSEEFIGKNVVEFIVPEDQPKALENLQTIFKQETENNFESRLLRKDGTVFYGQINAAVIEDKEHQPIGFIFIVRDINEQKRAQIALIESEERFDRLSASAFEGIAITLNGKIVDANERFAEIVGYQYDEIIGMNPLNLVAPESKKQVLQNIKSRYEKPYEHLAQRKDGSVFPVEALGKAIPYKGLTARVTSIRDISEHKRTAERLRKSEELLAETEKIAKVGGWELDLETMTPTWTEQTYRIHELEPDKQPTLEEAINFYAPESRPMIENAIQNAINNGISWDLELAFITAKSNHIWVRAIGKPHFENKKVIKLSGTFQDITKRKQSETALQTAYENLTNNKKELSAANQQLHASIEQLITNEKALTESEERFRLLVENAGDALFLINANGQIIDTNKEAYKNLGYSREELLKMFIWDISQDRTPQKFGEDFNKVKQNEKLTVEGTHIRKDGTTLPVEIRLGKLETNSSICLLALARDITERKIVEHEIQKAKEIAEEASQAKSDFFANMSHEIRTPLNGIMGYTELLYELDLDEEQREYVNTIERSAESLLNIVNNILAFSKMDAGQLKPKPTTFDLRSTVEEVVEALGLKAQQMGLKLISFYNQNLPNKVIGDPKRLQQILQSLLDNAIKFTDKGEIVLYVERVGNVEDMDTAKKSTTFLFSIQDTGIGIPADRFDRLFESFTQVDSTTTRAYGGLGLGLPIAKKLTEMMDGEMNVESEPGKGSIFSFTIKFQIVKDEEESN